MDNVRLGKLIREARGNMSLREFALGCGISHTHVDSIERGVDPRTGKPVSVTVETLEKLSKATGYSVEYLLGNESLEYKEAANKIPATKDTARIGQRVKKLRRLKKISPEDLAFLANISCSYLTDVEKGRYCPSLEILTGIAKGLTTSVAYLLGETDDPEVYNIRPDLLVVHKRIKSRREEMGLTQAELAEKLGYEDASPISKIEEGKDEASQSKIFAFAKVLDTTTAYLMGWTDDPTENTPQLRGAPTPQAPQEPITENEEEFLILAHNAEQLTDEERTVLYSEIKRTIGTFIKLRRLKGKKD